MEARDDVWELLVITMLNGQKAHVNPQQIVSIVEARDADDPGKHFTSQVRCVIAMTDGRTITTEEQCDAVEIRIHEIAVKRIEEMRK